MKLHSRFTAILLVYVACLNICAFANGLKFNGSEHLIDKRTSYEVFDHNIPRFSDKLNISFDISLLEPSHFGYIVRVKDGDANKTYNLSYYIDGVSTLFKFNEEGGKNLITARLNSTNLQHIHWLKVAVIFDSQKRTLTLNVNNQSFKASNINFPKKWTPNICFGKSDYLIDVPSFAIKQLSVSDDNHIYKFPLKESKGNIAHDETGKAYGRIANPTWLINDAYYWSYKQTIRSASIAGCNFDAKTDNLYIFNKDSLVTYNVRTGNKTTEAFTGKCPVDIFLGTNFLDNEAGKLYAYEVCNEKKEKGPNVAALDTKTKQWSITSYASLYMQLHHHSASFDPRSKRYFIFGGFGGFGGFGNMQYSKSLFSYNLATNKWDSLQLKGDRINPRYFSSMDYKKGNNSLYIFGGMGNESGEQVVGRRYFYDLHKIDLNTNTVTQLWEIPWTKENIVPVREMIIQDDSTFYTLGYPEHFSHTFLKLYRFSVKDGSYKILGDSIPIRSEKIKTKANIYYSSNLNSLIAVVQEFDNYDISSSIKVYSLAFPPISYQELISNESFTESHAKPISIIVILLLLAGAALFITIKRRKTKTINVTEINTFESNDYPDSAPVLRREQMTLKPNSIYLFGEFRVHDRKNKDITYMFSAKLKQAFLTILQYSSQNGISSQKLSEMLWPDKPEDKVKNSRGVTINHLRKIMKEQDGIGLIYEKGMFKIVIDPALCYCDYLRCIEIIDSNTVENNISELVDIVKQGKFLKTIHLSDFDSFKENVEKRLEPALLLEAERNFQNEAFDLTLLLCEAIFDIDPINDDAIYYTVNALSKQRMNNEAKKQYFFFISEYKKTMGQEYSLSLTDLLSGKKKSVKY